MSESVKLTGVEARIAQENLQRAAGCRIALQYGPDISADAPQ
jgi:hypothetical protein